MDTVEFEKLGHRAEVLVADQSRIAHDLLVTVGEAQKLVEANSAIIDFYSGVLRSVDTFRNTQRPSEQIETYLGIPRKVSELEAFFALFAPEHPDYLHHMSVGPRGSADFVDKHIPDDGLQEPSSTVDTVTQPTKDLQITYQIAPPSPLATEPVSLESVVIQALIHSPLRMEHLRAHPLIAPLLRGSSDPAATLREAIQTLNTSSPGIIGITGQKRGTTYHFTQDPDPDLNSKTGSEEKEKQPGQMTGSSSSKTTLATRTRQPERVFNPATRTSRDRQYDRDHADTIRKQKLNSSNRISPTEVTIAGRIVPLTPAQQHIVDRLSHAPRKQPLRASSIAASCSFSLSDIESALADLGVLLEQTGWLLVGKSPDGGKEARFAKGVNVKTDDSSNRR
jgi:hypothetical protein